MNKALATWINTEAYTLKSDAIALSEREKQIKTHICTRDVGMVGFYGNGSIPIK